MRPSERFEHFAVTDNSCHDGEMLGGLLDEITDLISQVNADGAYDTGYCYDFIEERGAVAGIPRSAMPSA